MDLSKLSDADLQAMASGDMSKVSEEGLKIIAGQQPHKPRPTTGPDMPGPWEAFLIGAGRTTDRLGKGAQQLYYGATGDQKAQAQLKAQAEEEDRLYKPLQDAHPIATGLGESLPSMAVPVGGSATLLGNMGRMALAAGVPTALEYGSVKERATRGGTAAAAAGLAPAGLALLGAAGRTAKAFVEPLYPTGRDAVKGRLLNRLAGDDAPNVVAKLKAAQPLVPGSLPTAAEVAENGGIAAFQRTAQGANPTDYTTRFMQQASARNDALRSIAGDPAAMEAAVAARSAITKPMYDQVTNAFYKVDDTLDNLLDRPIMQKALERARTVAKNDNRPFELTSKANAPFSGVGGGQAESGRWIGGQGVQDLKMALDDMLKDPNAGIVGKERQQVDNLRGLLIGWMEHANPDFQTARQTYAKMSQPINQMEVGKELLKKLQPALSDYGALGKETGATFARVLRDPENLIKSTTGLKRAPDLETLMGPEKIGALTAIGQDLARKSNAQSLGGSFGSDTFQKLAMNDIAAQSGAASMVSHMLEAPGIHRALNWIYRNADENMQREIAAALLDPAKAAALMERAPSFMETHPDIAKALAQSAQRIGFVGALTLTQGQ